jgi:Holliday junction resolvasome RuvABC DNA-binding subunit
MAQIVEVNCTTGEQTIRDLTDEEEAARAAAVAEAEAEREAAEAAEAKQAADKASGDAKLKALGFTDDEIAAR